MIRYNRSQCRPLSELKKIFENKRANSLLESIYWNQFTGIILQASQLIHFIPVQSINPLVFVLEAHV